MAYNKCRASSVCWTLILLSIQYLTTPIFTGVRAFGQQIGNKKLIKRVNREQSLINSFTNIT